MRIAFIINSLTCLCCSVFLLSGCAEKNEKSSGNITEPSFYHWKSVFAPTNSELTVLKSNNVKNIYLRFFDVDWNTTNNQPSPIAQVRIPDATIFSDQKLGVIPTVFITNECIQKISMEQCGPLAENIYKLISNIASVNQIDPIKEIQIDCDWTAATKDKYFSLLESLQKIDTAHLYSATIRLFQVKYKNDAGVPPVKKGMLMCYNMGNLKSPLTNNSIIDPGELKKYTSNLDAYPLPLDVALPLFSWYVLFRENGYAGLLQDIGSEALKGMSKPIGPNRIEIVKDTAWNNVSLKKGDLLRYENSSYDDIIKSASIIREKIKNTGFRLSLYHLDSIILSKYSTHEMENIFNSLH